MHPHPHLPWPDDRHGNVALLKGVEAAKFAQDDRLHDVRVGHAFTPS